MHICVRCKESKEDDQFSKNAGKKDKSFSYCKACAKKYREEYRKKNPWRLTYRWVHTRCNNPNAESYAKYGAIGIKNFLTHEDLETLWKRDNASSMRRASIDRIDSKGHYEVGNCRYVELSVNSTRGRRPRAP
jgi:predicted metal-dependent hydrolase